MDRGAGRVDGVLQVRCCDAFEARDETFLTDAKAEPNQEKWATDVAIQLRD